MPFLAALLSTTFIVSLIARIIAGLGFSVVAFVGIDLALDSLELQMESYLNGFPLSAKQLLDMAGVTTIVFWIIQAYAARVLLNAGKSVFMRTSSKPS